MSFVLYELDSSNVWKAVREVELAGQDGPLAKFVQSRAADSLVPFEWRLFEEDILTLLGLGNAANRALVLEGSSPARICEMWGFSDTHWTSVLIRMEMRSMNTVYQLLHLRGGTVDRTWAWESAPGMDGPLLAPAALRFFMQSIDGQEPRHSGKPRQHESEAEARMQAEMCSDLDAIFGPKRERPLEQQHRSEDDKLLYEKMRRDLDTVLGTKPRQEEYLTGGEATSPEPDSPDRDPKAPFASVRKGVIHRAFITWAKSR